MGKLKKLFLVVLLTLIINDVCLYIRHFIYEKPKRIISFDLVVTRFDHGFIINYSIVFIFVVSFLYFIVNFFKSEK